MEGACSRQRRDWPALQELRHRLSQNGCWLFVAMLTLWLLRHPPCCSHTVNRGTRQVLYGNCLVMGSACGRLHMGLACAAATDPLN